ncbi:hypothetical protein PYCCODRAFT_667066 [Trametes coccinea BRFM310]|uniref:F-box domain-containing protein n=1 Tax=Trametes coccinea (strain BRFM310) TaxID=1353009 RepID=A0A1Y2IHB3_TRAC3|nr:hypothetical protein PYCCODRAFT_667066 [Trametes coccinea BRFM310]
MPRSLADLPFDVLSEIWEYLAGDQCALRASALTCKAVLPLSQRRLFTTVDFAKLSNADFISAFGDYVTELRCVGSRLGIEEEAGLDRRRLLSAALELTRLRALELRCVGLFEREEPLPDFRYLSTARFISVTTLILRGTVHTKLAEAKRLINSLPALAHLSLADMNIRTSVYFGIPGFGNPPAIVDENEFDEDADRAGPRLVSLRVECRRSLTHGATALVRWLARTPTAHTLRRLDLSWEGIRDALVPLATFGPAVDDLAFSLDDLAGTFPAPCTRRRGLTQNNRQDADAHGSAVTQAPARCASVRCYRTRTGFCSRASWPRSRHDTCVCSSCTTPTRPSHPCPVRTCSRA